MMVEENQRLSDKAGVPCILPFNPAKLYQDFEDIQIHPHYAKAKAPKKRKARKTANTQRLDDFFPVSKQKVRRCGLITPDSTDDAKL